MSALGRVREASVQVAKVQRRIWLLQALFWPILAITGVVVAFVVARSAWQRRASATAVPQEPVGLNTAVTGN